MKNIWVLATSFTAVVLLVGCETVPPGTERGPHGTIAYDVLVEASEPGARIEAEGNHVGNTPVHLKIFGDRDGTFHDFGDFQYVIQAFPLTTNQFAQVRAFGTGRAFSPEDRIPQHIYFDMNQPRPRYPVAAPPVYGYPPDGPPVYYYGPPPYYGPTFRFNFGPRGYRRW